MTDFVFVTGNQNKVMLLERFLGQKVKHNALDLLEVQSLDPQEVIEHKVREAFRILKRPVLVEDTSLKFTAFGKLPGPMIKYFLSEIGNSGLAKMLDNCDDRSAIVSVTYGLFDGSSTHFFSASLEGIIAAKPRGTGGHGFDPIFIPNGSKLTYAELFEQNHVDIEKFSVRNLAVQKLKKHLL